MSRAPAWGGRWHVLPIAARSPAELQSASDAVAAFVAGNRQARMEDVALTLQVREPVGTSRKVVVARDRGDAVRLLTTGGGRVVEAHASSGAGTAIVFVFPGVGDQYVGMCAGLLSTVPSFRSTVDRDFERVQALIGVDLEQTLYPDGVAAHAREHVGREYALDLQRLLSDPESGSSLSSTLVSQPTTFVMASALAALVREFGVAPDAMLGYSVGEYAAATMAAVFGGEDGLKVVARRAQLIEELAEPGAMLAVSCSSSEFRSRLPSGVWIATSGGPTLTVLAGRRPAIRAFADHLHAEGVATRQLPTEHAFHSPLMSPVARRLADDLGRVDLAAPAVRFLSNLTGDWITAAEATHPGYWAQHLEKCVRLDRNVAAVTAVAEDIVLVELGPGQTLATLVVQAARASGRDVPRIAQPLRGRAEMGDDVLIFLLALAHLWASGAAMHWKPLHGPPWSPIELPQLPGCG